MGENLLIPVLPLRNAVLFPGVTFPISAGRPGTLKAIETALKASEHLVFAVAQTNSEEDVKGHDLHTVGTIAVLGTVHRGIAGARLLLQGQGRGIAMRFHERDGMLEAAVVLAKDSPLDERDPASIALHKELRERSAELGKKMGLPDETVEQVLSEASDPGRLADLVAGYIDIPFADRQKLLETFSVEDRVGGPWSTYKLCLRSGGTRGNQVQGQQEISGRQREMFLREQLRTIQKELGEDEAGIEESHLKDLKAKLDALELPEEARKEVDREWARLKWLRGRVHGEFGRADVPRNGGRASLEHPQRGPPRCHGGCPDSRGGPLRAQGCQGSRPGISPSGQLLVSRDLVESDDVKTPGRALDHGGRGKILLFIGPPGVGKTSIAKSIARADGGGSTSGSHSVGRATRPTSGAIAGPTSGHFPAGFSTA